MQIIASKKQTEAKRKQTQEAVEMWNSRAELAVKSGQDELAREALKKRKANKDQLKTWDQQLEQQNKAVDQLMGNTREMESKMQEAKSKKDTLKARAATAKSTKQVCWGLLYGCMLGLACSSVYCRHSCPATILSCHHHTCAPHVCTRSSCALYQHAKPTLFVHRLGPVATPADSRPCWRPRHEQQLRGV